MTDRAADAPSDAELAAAVSGRAVRSVGTDVVDIARMGRICGRRPRFVARVFTDDEANYAGRGARPEERFAVRFAAKEAVMKALGVGLGAVDFRDIEVVRADTGAPSIALHGRAARRAEALGITAWLVSLSHGDEVAYAVVLGLAEGRDDAAR